MKASWYLKREGNAEHLVYLDKKANELNKLLNKQKTMIVRGAAGKKVPLGGRVKVNDVLYFVETQSNFLVTHKAYVSNVLETDKMTEEESVAFINKYNKELNLAKHQYNRWAGKKFLCLIEISNIEEIQPFKYRRDNNMDDWIITDTIDEIKINE